MILKIYRSPVPQCVTKSFNASSTSSPNRWKRFGIIALNAKHKINGVHIIGSGAIDRVYVEPRQVYMAALMNNAKAIITFHCYPSGDPTFSRDDLISPKDRKKPGRSSVSNFWIT
jgi:DNA repair protein RadC